MTRPSDSKHQNPIPIHRLVAQYRRAFAYVLPYWRSLILVVLLGLFSTLVGLAQPYISRLLIDKALLRRDLHALVQIAVAMVVITILSFILNIVSSYRYVRLSAESLFEMRLAIYRHLQTLSPRFFANSKLGDLVSRINNDIGEVQRICSDTLLSVFSTVLFLFGSLAIMALLNWKLFLASIVLLPVSLVALRHYQKRLTIETKTLRERSADLGSFLIESLSAMRLIVATNNEAREAHEFRARNSRFLDALLSMQMTAFLASALPGAVLATSTAIVFIYGGQLVIENHLTIGGLIAFMAYHLRLLSPVQALLSIHTNLLTGGVALGRVFEILDIQPEVRQAPDALPCRNLRGEITFDRVSFRYAADVPVLHEISFRIPAGSTCAIVGPSGRGKSTLADLLLRFYDPDSGSISIDAVPLRALSLEGLRREVALVEQTPLLFRASISENLSYGRPSATTEEIHGAARAAAIADFIESLPNGYESLIGERGCTLSAGERQRLALARALLRNPSVLILDEPTAALDPQSESIIAKTIEANSGHRTVILITHRMSLARHAGMVLLLDENRISEITHQSEPLTRASDFWAAALAGNDRASAP